MLEETAMTQEVIEEVHFTGPAAEAKIGRRIRTLIQFSTVPAGTTGAVIRADRAGGGYDVAIQWDLPNRQRPLVDWFRRDEYERFLEEIKPSAA